MRGLLLAKRRLKGSRTPQEAKRLTRPSFASWKHRPPRPKVAQGGLSGGLEPKGYSTLRCSTVLWRSCKCLLWQNWGGAKPRHGKSERCEFHPVSPRCREALPRCCGRATSRAWRQLKEEIGGWTRVGGQPRRRGFLGFASIPSRAATKKFRAGCEIVTATTPLVAVTLRKAPSTRQFDAS